MKIFEEKAKALISRGEAMQNYFEYVTAAEAQLHAEGHSLTGQMGNAEQGDGEKGRLTRRAAYLINRVNPNIGLVQKNGGPGGVSSDLVLDRTNGDFSDVATTTDHPESQTFSVVPRWSEGSEPPLVSRWVQPTKELAGIEDGTEPGGGEPGGGETGGGAVTNAELLAAVTSAAAVLNEVARLAQATDQKLAAHLQQTSHFNLFGLGTTKIYPDGPAADVSRVHAPAALSFPPFTLPANVSLADLLKAIQTIAAVIVAVQQLFAQREMQ